MSFTDENSINLADLPSDVIKNIIDVGVESMNTMRLISPRWNSIALDHLRNRRKLPAFEQIRWHKGSNLGFNVNFMSMFPDIKYEEYFGITDLQKEADIKCFLYRFTKQILHYFRCDRSSFVSKIHKRLMRCSRIERVEIKDFGTDISLDKDFEELEQALRDTIINELAFIGKLEIKSRESQAIALDLIRSLSPKKLIFNRIVPLLHGIVGDGIHEFFIEAAQIVSEIEFSTYTHIKLSPIECQNYWEDLCSSVANKCNFETHLEIKELIGERSVRIIAKPLKGVFNTRDDRSIQKSKIVVSLFSIFFGIYIFAHFYRLFCVKSKGKALASCGRSVLE